MLNRLFARWVAERLFGLAEITMPAERNGWMRAMRAEADYVEPGAATLMFAAGCVWAAWLECLAAEIRKGAAVPAGIAMGVVFAAHATVRDSHAWPLIWPLLGGTLAVLLYARNGGRLGFRGGAWLGLQTGAITGLLFGVAGAVLISVSADVTLSSRLQILAAGILAGVTLSASGGGAAALLARSA